MANTSSSSAISSDHQHNVAEDTTSSPPQVDIGVPHTRGQQPSSSTSTQTVQVSSAFGVACSPCLFPRGQRGSRRLHGREVTEESREEPRQTSEKGSVRRDHGRLQEGGAEQGRQQQSDASGLSEVPPDNRTRTEERGVSDFLNVRHLQRGRKDQRYATQTKTCAETKARGKLHNLGLLTSTREQGSPLDS